MTPDIIIKRAPDGSAVVTCFLGYERGYYGARKETVLPQVVRHSPTGFEWGYAGSGPADLALSILAQAKISEPLRDSSYQVFKEQFIAALPYEGGTIRGATIDAWLDQRDRISPHYIHRGCFAKTWWDTGAMGMQPMYGVVREAGRRAAVIEWRSGIRNRVLLLEPRGVEFNLDQSSVDLAKEQWIKINA